MPAPVAEPTTTSAINPDMWASGGYVAETGGFPIVGSGVTVTLVEDHPSVTPKSIWAAYKPVKWLVQNVHGDLDWFGYRPGFGRVIAYGWSDGVVTWTEERND